ncbi:hypothetical protein JYP49_14360 [Nitratireductor aquimarinus]|uniref:hypothetical protein n=1 Tax=Nitratireductor TaxID=245876 RepID=UPI0019D3D578|nr:MULTISPECIES: hypothetical protein [Nitratireductor]MBN7777780.1 hypothetical protein [Nitratireductor pacificus]MBN7781774.1 hypothetical protein [Nitratireductor pacificus]MBN7790580.1 hypothetical protein [Nitratireductor aquimarinus]MBY6099990.1 hypothetical protein [Nitratireductor aquimarinus]MCA1260454.1 hypothetical protein [Nitratireductor aquimarinus]
MANVHRGGVTLKAGENAYTLSFSINAMCELEDAFGKPVMEVIEDFQNVGTKGAAPSIKTVRTLIWAALIDHHPEMTVEDAGRISLSVDVNTLMEKVGTALQRAFPSQEGDQGKANPPKAKAE